MIKMEDTMKIHKFTVYIYGFNDEARSTISDAMDALSETKQDYIIHPYHETTTEMEYIEDYHPLNKQNIPKELWEKYMDKKLKGLLENKIRADKELEEYKKEKGL